MSSSNPLCIQLAFSGLLFFIGCSTPAPTVLPKIENFEPLPPISGEEGCASDEEPSLTSLDLTIKAILQGRYENVKVLLEDHQAETDVASVKEARIILKLVSLLESELVGFEVKSRKEVEERVAIISLALDVVSAIEAELFLLRERNKALELDLSIREETLKRLRALTIGPPEE